MTPQLVPASRCNPDVLVKLKGQLDDFYGSVTDYSAFATPSEQVHCWTHIAQHIRAHASTTKKFRILEVGAGMSGFGTYLSDQNLRHRCTWIAQDVTTQNRTWLEKNADEVLIGHVDSLNLHGSYDIVFSTFVLEHVVNPESHLNTLARLVRPSKGTIFIFCPRYDFPGYATPSCRHLGVSKRLWFMCQGLFSRTATILTGSPAFLVQTDLAAFHLPFFTDADAVHWASAIDLKRWARSHKASSRSLKLGDPRFPSKDWIVKRLLTIGIAIAFDQ